MSVLPDPKWLEILKASGWQFAAIAVASGLFLLANNHGWLPPLDEYKWAILLAWSLLLLFGCLAVASFFTALFKILPIHIWGVHAANSYRERLSVRDYIPHMTDEDRSIIAYLLAHNQKSFTGAVDGGYAVTLISRGIVVRATRPGHSYGMEDIPYAIPDNVWKELQRNKDQFPHKPPPIGETERYPWRVPWQLR